MNTKTEPAGEWLQDGGLLYRLNEHDNNCDEINITMVDGSREMDARAAAAVRLLPALVQRNATTAEMLAAAPKPPAETHPEDLANWRLGYERYEKARRIKPYFLPTGARPVARQSWSLRLRGSQSTCWMSESAAR